MRTAPTSLEQSGTTSDYLIAYTNTASLCSSVPVYATATVNYAKTTYTLSSGLTAGWAVNCAANTANGTLAWSAEL